MFDLITALREQTAHDHPVATVEVIETHISWVLLTGEFAYKIKKPVNLGFVDFTTLEKRLGYCREEMRLNGRLAPDLYLGVVPVTAGNDGPQFGGDGPVLEYAVKMRQFSQDALLDRLLKRGELLPAHIDALAAEVAEFHQQTAIADINSPFGDPAAIWSPVEENFRHIAGSPDHPTRTAQLQKLRAWTEGEFHRREPVFSRRKADGKIRECHGDLHLGNMILDGEAVVLFDCIEFNESFRWIDVMSEIAFTVMDLGDRGRKDLAARFLNKYLGHTGDYAGLEVLRYYLVYRATVRAKVAAIRLAQPGLDAETRAETDRLLQSYLDLAEGDTHPPSPRLLLTHGVSGTGKSSVTGELLQELSAVRIRSDVERKRLFPDEDAARGLYTAAATEKTYAQMATGVRAVIDGGFIAIADATFLHRRHRDQFRNLADELGVPLTLLDFTAPVEVLRERVTKRAAVHNDVSDADLAVLERQLQQQEPLGADEAVDVVEIATDQSIDMSAIVRRLQRN